MNILDAMDDPAVFGRHFRTDTATWAAWRAFLATLFALPLTPEQFAIYRKYTGRSTPPTEPLNEAWLVIGRRGGKSFILATIAVFLAAFKDWRPFLGPGEVATIMIIARDRKQARVIKRFITGLLHEVPMLRAVIATETQEIIQLKNRISIEIHTASFRSTRGYTIVAALLDEIAFWETDETSSEPDVEVINAIKPGMATIPGAMLLCASSPHARKGALWNAHRKHFGKEGDPVLVWQAATRDMNASVPQHYIDAHIADDPVKAAAEYGAVFRSDVETYVLREAVEACISVGVYERPPEPGEHYFAFADPAGGSGGDSMTLAIAHLKYGEQSITIDALRERKPPFSPEQVTKEFAELLLSYGITTIIGDRVGGMWAVEQFSKFGIHYEPAARPKNALYVDFLPLVNSCRVELLDHPRCIAQLCSLERSTVRGRGENIDHPPGQHDDIINAVAGVASISIGKYGYDISMRWVNGDDADDPDGARAWRAARLAAYLHSGGRVRL